MSSAAWMICCSPSGTGLPACRSACTGGVAHLGTRLLHGGFGAGADFLARQAGVQGEGQLLVEQPGADAEVALRLRHQHGVQPLSDARPPPCADFRPPPSAPPGRRAQHLGLGQDHAVHDAHHAAILLGDGGGMDGRHPRRHDAGAHLRQQTPAAPPSARWPPSAAAAAARYSRASKPYSASPARCDQTSVSQAQLLQHLVVPDARISDCWTGSPGRPGCRATAWLRSSAASSPRIWRQKATPCARGPAGSCRRPASSKR